jgi:hypothetical protein
MTDRDRWIGCLWGALAALPVVAWVALIAVVQR